MRSPNDWPATKTYHDWPVAIEDVTRRLAGSRSSQRNLEKLAANPAPTDDLFESLPHPGHDIFDSMTDDEYRELNYYSHCLQRDSATVDTYHPDYFPSLRRTWEIYKKRGWDRQFDPTEADRQEWKRITDYVTEKCEFYDKLGILPESCKTDPEG